MGDLPMADAPEQPKRPSWRLQVRGCLLAALIALAVLACGAVCFLEWAAYTWGTDQCRSDNMFVLMISLEEYAQQYEGQLPAAFDQLREYVRAKYKSPYAYDECHRAEKPFIWMPPGVKMKDGRPVILMCPPNSHGWLRKYAVGLVRDGNKFRFVRVRGNRATFL